MVCSDGRCAEEDGQGQKTRSCREREVHHPGNIAGSSQAHWFSLLLKAGCFRRILATCIGQGTVETNYVHHSSGPLLHDAGPVLDIERKRNFQRKMEELLEGLRGVECYQDDIIVHGRTVEEHNSVLQTVLQRIKESGLKLNQQKCIFSQTELEFLGHKIALEGTNPHPNKVRAIVDLEQPSNVSELRIVMEMVNHLGQYLPHLSTVKKLLNDLLKTDSVWNWGYEQQEAFTKIKIMVTSAPTLPYFDPNKPTTTRADASCYGIGGVLLQESDGKQHPVALCSHTLTTTEQQYAQIERERVLGTCLELREVYTVPSWTPFVSFDHGSKDPGTTNRRNGLEYGAIEVSTSPDAYDVVQS